MPFSRATPILDCIRTDLREVIIPDLDELLLHKTGTMLMVPLLMICDISESFMTKVVNSMMEEHLSPYEHSHPFVLSRILDQWPLVAESRQHVSLPHPLILTLRRKKPKEVTQLNEVPRGTTSRSDNCFYSKHASRDGIKLLWHDDEMRNED